MVSPFGLQASAQCTYSYNDLLCAKVLVRHFQLFRRHHSCQNDYTRGEAGLKHRYCILGHCEQIHSYENRPTRLPCKEGKEEVKNNTQLHTTQEGIEQIKNNPQVYTTREGIGEIKINPQVYTTQQGIKEIKNNPQVYTTQEGREEIKNNPQVYPSQEGI